MSKRPDMRAYFRAEIDSIAHHRIGSPVRPLPHGVARVAGTVESSRIVVTMRDQTMHVWQGGEYGSRKVDGDYPPLMPTPID